ncbi:hypothetical protein M3668_08010 [Rothia sp. P100]|nr:hypothetical protein [Rothia sp. P100]MCM3510714.1 hypothetical protein [Rothia sp. P100]
MLRHYDAHGALIHVPAHPRTGYTAARPLTRCCLRRKTHHRLNSTI